MTSEHYSKYFNKDNKDNPEPLTLRDYLAIDRTLLANERSFLAYTRTALTMLIAAVSLIKFFDSNWTLLAGEILLAGTALTFIRGLRRYKATQHIMAELEGIKEQTSENAHPQTIASRFLRLSQQLIHVFYK